MKYIISTFILLGMAGALRAQSLSPEVVATAGETYSSGTVIVDWTLGEIMTESYDGTLVLTQGFHQPELKITSIKTPLADLGPVKVYPNPSTGRISIEREKSGELQVLLLDMSGRVILQQQTAAVLTELELSHLATGIYILRLSDGKQASRTIRIEKL